MDVQEIRVLLKEAAEPDFAAFNKKLVPDTALSMSGVRVPYLRKLGAKIACELGESYLKNPCLDTYEEVMLTGIVTSLLKLPIDRYIENIRSFLPRIENWAVCDCFTAGLTPAKKYPEEFLKNFGSLYAHPSVYQRRFLAVLLLDHYITDRYIDTVLKLYEKINNGPYYVDMAIAWGISVALVKYYDKTVPYLKSPAFSPFIINKSIQKARESFRIPPERKQELLIYKAPKDK